MAAWLAAGPGAVVSHESALDIYGVSDVIPDRIHITVPRTRRGSRRPRGVALHTPDQSPGPEEVLIRSGMRVTAPVRTMLDVTRAGLGPDHVARAVTQMINRGLTTAKELKAAANLHSGRVSRTISDSLASAQ